MGGYENQVVIGSTVFPEGQTYCTSRREVLQGPRFAIAPPAALPNF